jgi:hypothetical protein
MTANACSCMGAPSPQEALRDSHAAFTGRVVDVQTIVLDYGKNKVDMREVTLEAAIVWKGEVAKQQKVITAVKGGECGYNFTMGHSYIVYARLSGDALVTGLCSGTKPLERAENDLRDLGTGAAPRA